LQKIEVLLKAGNVENIHSIIQSEIATFNQCNKIQKIADRHGWDTVHRYLDDPLADNVEDASKFRSVVIQASKKRTHTNKPYARGAATGGFNPRVFFRGFSQNHGHKNPNFTQNSAQYDTIQYNDVNQYVLKQKVKFEGVKEAKMYEKKGYYMFKFDLHSGYHHFDIHAEHQKYLGF
jgi:hypothetical protein